MIRFFLVLLLSFVPFLTEPLVAGEMELNHYVLCKSRGNVRSVYVEKGSSGCTTHYTKGGRPEVIGSGTYVETCVGFLNNVLNNLSDANWQCKSAARAVIQQEETH